VLPGANDSEKLEALSQKPYKDQVVWFLNAFWEVFAEPHAETIWKYCHKYEDLDLEKKTEGTGLDELNAHRFLEFFKDTHTVSELRAKLRETGALPPSAKPKLVPITHFLLFQYNADYRVLVNASQGDNAKEIAEAQRRLDEVSAAFEASDARAREADAAFREALARDKVAKETEAEAKAREADAIQREAPFKAAQEELEAALAELKAQEDAYQAKKEDLERRSNEGNVVQANKAKNELAQLLAENPLPLRKAKITTEAATKKAEKARAPFEAARKQAEDARAAASAAAQEASNARTAASRAKDASERAKEAADQALDDARRLVQEAEDYLQEIRSKPGCAYGAMWWMSRELEEKKKYLPERKGGVRKAD
jgi:DNA repair exonuclease SbcCD ATPase subunit